MGGLIAIENLLQSKSLNKRKCVVLHRIPRGIHVIVDRRVIRSAFTLSLGRACSVRLCESWDNEIMQYQRLRDVMGTPNRFLLLHPDYKVRPALSTTNLSLLHSNIGLYHGRCKMTKLHDIVRPLSIHKLDKFSMFDNFQVISR